jgi:hypothetical protein
MYTNLVSKRLVFIVLHRLDGSVKWLTEFWVDTANLFNKLEEWEIFIVKISATKFKTTDVRGKS